RCSGWLWQCWRRRRWAPRAIRWRHDRRCSRDRWRAGERRARGRTDGVGRDAGAPPERPSLSWHRSVLAGPAAAPVAWLPPRRAGHPLLAAIAAVAGFVLLGGALYRLRYWHARAPRWAVLRQAAVAVIVLSLIGTSLATVNFLDTISP